MNNEFLENQKARIRVVGRKVEAQFNGLSFEQFNWKPSAQAWSIGQCIHHLSRTHYAYSPILEASISGALKTSFFSKLWFPSRLMGKYILKKLKPDGKTKLKSPKIFKPMESSIPLAALVEFRSVTAQLIELISNSENLDLKKTIINSPASPLISFALGEVYEMMADHQERHLLQAEKIIEHPSFPK